jgi:hypothetical protein
MGNSLPILQPVALARPRGAHRFEAFSLKLARRVTLYRFVALKQWVILEASPAVEAFCENPGLSSSADNKSLRTSGSVMPTDMS